MNLIQGDCLVEMDKLIEQGVKVDAIIADIPYGTIACKWDTVVPFNDYIMVEKRKKQVPMYKSEWINMELKSTHKNIHQCENEFDAKCNKGMWDKLTKLIKSDGAIVLFGNEPFSSKLRCSNLDMYKYDWKWEKSNGANFLNFKYQPAKVHEDIMVFGKMATSYSKNGNMKYYPIMEEGEKYQQKSGKQKTNNNNSTVRSPIEQVITVNDGTRYPRSINCFKKDKSKLHPTQKPVALMEYLIKTYTNENETVLDFTMGSGSTGVACRNLGRDFIGIELDKKYFEIAKKRIDGVIR